MKNSLKKKLLTWKKKGLSIGVCNGCFDLLHKGHLHLIRNSKKRCDKLLILLNSDKSVKKIKGKERPIENEKKRKSKLIKFKEISDVMIFKESTPLKIIKDIKPDYIFKGSDYKNKRISGQNYIKKYGGKTILIKILKNYSTTNIINQK